jgi:anti-sigma B factor antagonist
MTFDFSLSEDTDQDAHVIAVSGEVDIFTAPELKRAIGTAIDEGARRIVVDLTDTRFLDSTALGVLIGAVKRLRLVDGRMMIVNTEASTAKTFEITGLDQIFEIVAAREEAVAALSGE